MVSNFQSKQKRQMKKEASEKRPTQKVKGNPRLVLGLLLVTMFLSGIFWLKSNIGDLWDRLMQPARYEFVNPEVVDEKLLKLIKGVKTQGDVVEAIEELTGELVGTYGVYVYKLDKDKRYETGDRRRDRGYEIEDKGEEREYGVNQEEVFTAASVNKVPIMAAILQEIEEGNLTFEDQYRLQGRDVQDYGTGTMRYDRAGTLYTYDDLLELSGKKSDNTAAFVLQRIVGKEKLDILLADLEMENTSIEENTATPAEMARLFVEAYKGELFSDKFQERLYRYLTNTDFEDRIPMGVPDMTLVAHKIGTEMNVINDCGIIFEKNPYVLCILSKNVNEAEALEVLPKISRLVWEYEK